MLISLPCAGPPVHQLDWSNERTLGLGCENYEGKKKEIPVWNLTSPATDDFRRHLTPAKNVQICLAFMSVILMLAVMTI
jgi:hypothetical protein